MTDSEGREAKHARNRERRHEQTREWVAPVRTHPGEDRGTRVNTPVDSQLRWGWHFEDERPGLREPPDC